MSSMYTLSLHIQNDPLLIIFLCESPGKILCLDKDMPWSRRTKSNRSHAPREKAAETELTSASKLDLLFRLGSIQINGEGEKLMKLAWPHRPHWHPEMAHLWLEMVNWGGHDDGIPCLRRLEIPANVNWCYVYI